MTTKTTADSNAPADTQQAEVRKFLARLKRIGMEYGQDAVVSVIGGEHIEEPFLVPIRTEAENLLNSLGYWRANFHVWERHRNRFYAWHLPPQRLGEGRIHLPFIDLDKGIFRRLEDRVEIEKGGRWYDKAVAFKASESTSQRSLTWLNFWLQSHHEEAGEPFVIVHEGEMILWLLALEPSLLPLESDEAQQGISLDGWYALRKNSRTPKNLAEIVLRWLEGPIYQPTNYRDYLRRQLGTKHTSQLINLLNSLPKKASNRELVALSRRAPFSVLRKLGNSNNKLVRFRLTEPLSSGTRSMMIWPVSSYGRSGPSSINDRQSLLFCLVALQPHLGSPAPQDLNLLRQVIETCLLLTVPAQMIAEGERFDGTVAMKTMADILAHEVKSLAAVTKHQLSAFPTGPHELLLAECDVTACIAKEFQKVFKFESQALTHLDLEAALLKKSQWKKLRSADERRIPILKTDFPTPQAKALEVLLAILLELMRNAKMAKLPSNVAEQIVTVTVSEMSEGDRNGTMFSVSNFGMLSEDVLEWLAAPAGYAPRGEHGADLIKWTVETWLVGHIIWMNTQTAEGPMTVVKGWIPNQLSR